MKKLKQLIRCIRKVKKNTGEGVIKSTSKIIYAKICGISINDYVKYKYYCLNKNKLKMIGENEKKKKEYIKKINKESSLSEKQILNDAKKYDLKLWQYYKYKVWDLTEKDKESLKETIKKSIEKRNLNKKWYINIISEKTNCSKEEAEERLKIAKEKNYNELKFIVSGKYSLSSKELKNIEQYKKIRSKRIPLANKIIHEQEDKDRRRIMEEMNWNEAKLNLEILKSRINCGSNFHEFDVYNLYKMNPQKQKEFITTEVWRKLYLRSTDYADTWKYFKKKILFNNKFKKWIKRKWYSVETLNYNEYKKLINGEKEFIFKPLDTACGVGIRKYKVSKYEIINYITYKKIKHYKKGIVEQIIIQHKDMAKFNSETVNTIRIHTYYKDGKVDIINATVRFGASRGSFIDNWSAGGVIAPVDVKTGKIIGDGSTKFGELVEKHPISNVKFKGFQVPSWDKVLKMVEEAAKVVKTVSYVGWDAVINEDGSVQLIEGNHDGDATLQQYYWAIAKGKGIRDTIDKYIWFDEDEKTV